MLSPSHFLWIGFKNPKFHILKLQYSAKIIKVCNRQNVVNICFQIKEEILAVLNHIIQGENRHGSVSDLRHMSAQTVFSLLDHLTNFTRHRVVALYQMGQKEVQMTRSRTALESKYECPTVCQLFEMVHLFTFPVSYELLLQNINWKKTLATSS